jgi:hypothetical protein
MSRPSSVKLRSLLVWSSVLALGAAAAGCVVETRTSDGCYEDEWGDVSCYEAAPATSSTATTTTKPPSQPSTSPLTVSIETGRTLDAQPGAGVGLFVEYATGGKWKLHTTCDTATSGYACDFDVYATVDTAGTISNVASEGLESGDVAVRTDATVHFAARTTNGAQAVLFDATPGATIALEVWLDGALEGRYVYWMGSGIVHAGAPTNPVVFQPSAP